MAPHKAEGNCIRDGRGESGVSSIEGSFNGVAKGVEDETKRLMNESRTPAAMQCRQFCVKGKETSV